MSPSALVFGEALIDRFPDRSVVAGAPLHVATHLVHLGWHASVVSRIGDDEEGGRIREALEQQGVDVALLETDDSLPTGWVDIDLHGDGTHSFEIHGPVAWDAISGPQRVPSADVLYFGSLALRDDRSRGALERIESGFEGLRVVDINLRPPDDGADAVRFAVTRADVLKLSDEEVPAVAAILEVAADPAALLSAGPGWVCVTRGPDGASLHRADGGSWEREGLDLEVVDTVGAGDAFCAGLIDGLVRDLEPDEVLERAQARAAAIVQQRGGMPPPQGTAG
jgi:fructokinase